MASTVFLSTFSSAHLSSSFAGDYVASSRCFIGAPVASSSSLSLLSGKKNSYPFRKFHVSAKKVSGLEEAIRIRRMREAEATSKVKRNPPLRRGRVSPRLLVPDHIPKPPYAESGVLPDISPDFQIPSPEGLVKMRAACELAARVLNFAGTLVKPSVTTNEIDKAVHDMIVEAGAYPSPLGYGGFPKSVCTSVNECMCHGIPDSRQLQSGDIINIDVTVYLDGYHGDTSRTFFCGEVDEGFKRLVKVTEECLEKGIAVCKDGASFKKIGKRISEHAEKYGYNVVERFVGHGVGPVFHSEPLIYHYRNDEPGHMVEGQTFTIVTSNKLLVVAIRRCRTDSNDWNHGMCNMARQLDYSNS
ncbi:methionine aminopeptidase 1B, chloroplastic-like isoform X2 [Brassica napus]|uniref:methionine aminopeptidase 1B, chloroplastic-like isoform X2 n=1 Tax=Brassica napus TaxID=3708 RepID=UPI0006AAF58D|nr:methionine aminopeptidase 1B, chloroplastic-like isoform X2 [Brassica napus]